MRKYLLIGSISIFALSAISASAITLTKEAIEKVEMKAASGKICVWDAEHSKCIGDTEPVIFGVAKVYPRKSPPVDMTMFILRNKVYRSIGFSQRFYEENCRIIEETDPMKGTLQKKVCDKIIGVQEQFGDGSAVDPTGVESEKVLVYHLGYNLDGTFQTLSFTLYDQEFRLQSIDSGTVIIEWVPR